MLEFVNDNYVDFEILYYDAESENGRITSKSIIDGLTELKTMGVDKINISLSCKKYSRDIQKWIDENKDVKIFASYNNLINTFDYPARYGGVIASGKKEKNYDYKPLDIVYKSNRIFSLNTGKIYNGNSYLSIMSMLDSEE